VDGTVLNLRALALDPVSSHNPKRGITNVVTPGNQVFVVALWLDGNNTTDRYIQLDELETISAANEEYLGAGSIYECDRGSGPGALARPREFRIQISMPCDLPRSIRMDIIGPYRWARY
jgi:hypothetical protein